MAKCERINISKKKICIGDFNTLGQLYLKNIITPEFDSAENHQEYFFISNIWFGIQTLNSSSSYSIFDQIAANEDTVVTNSNIKMYCRYRNDITTENNIVISNQNYEILKVINIDLKNEYLLLFGSTKGNFDFQGAK